MILRFLAGLASLTLLVGTGFSQDKDKSADEQVKNLIVKYRALPDKDKVGPEGAVILKELKAVRGELSIPSREAIARLETAHNLRQLSLRLQEFEERGAKPPQVDPTVLANLLPYIEQANVFTQPRLRWEYKVVPPADVLILGKDDLAGGLNKLGEEGWELIGIEKTRMIFKRPK